MDAKANRSRATFSGLPREIRDMIYKEAFPDHNVEVKWERSKNKRRDISRTYGSPSIMYVCECVQAEVKPLWYKGSYFVLEFGSRPIWGVRRTQMLSGRSLCAPRGVAGWIYGAMICFVESIHGLVRPFPRLQEFRLKFPRTLLLPDSMFRSCRIRPPPVYDLRHHGPLLANLRVLVKY